MVFGNIQDSNSFGSRTSPPDSRAMYCWLVEGARGTYRQRLEAGTMWMYIQGYWFKECRCLEGNPPDICKSPVVRNKSGWSSDVNIDRNGTNWERIDSCSATGLKCADFVNEGGVYWEVHDDYPPCKGYTRCCFSGRLLVDDDVFFDGDACKPFRLIGSTPFGLHDWPCEHHIDGWLDSNPPNPECNMDLDCKYPSGPPVAEDNNCLPP